MHEAALVEVDRRLARGLRLRAHKATSTADSILTGLTPSRLIIAMEQHLGAPAVPIVQVGDRVHAGQTIAKPGPAPSAAVHTPMAGTVTGIESRLLCGGEGQCVVIDTDDTHSLPEDRADPAPLTLETLRNAGIAGLGGAVFPTADKIRLSEAANLLVLNGAECEPYISCDDMLMREQAGDLIAGAQAMLELIGLEECVVAIESDKPEALHAVSEAIRNVDDRRIKIAEVPTVYPAGGERQLIQVLKGVEVPAGGYPPDIGFLVQNVGTAVAIAQWARQSQPLTHRVVTVTGDGVRKPRNVLAPIGTPIADLVAACGGYTEDAVRLIMGGSMMGLALPSDEIPVTKATNCILVAGESEVRDPPQARPCIRCGDCAVVCPAVLLPQELFRAAQHRDFDMLNALSLSECIECGCCDVVCPSHIPLTKEFLIAKKELARHVTNLARADTASKRVQANVERRESLAAAERAAQDQLVAPLADPTTASDAIAAARARTAARKKDT